MITRIAQMLIVSMTLITFIYSAWADDRRDLMNEDRQLQQRHTQLQQAINNITIRRAEIQGVLKYLNQKDREKIAEPEEEAKIEGTD